MPKFSVCLTRDCTESVWIVVEATDREDAVETAMDQSRGPLAWEHDDCSGGPAYIADPDSTEEVRGD